MSFGPQLDGQCCYTGWLASPIIDNDGTQYVDHQYTIAKRKVGEAITRVTLETARALVQEFSYRSDVNGDGFINVQGHVKDKYVFPVEGATAVLEMDGIKYDEGKSEVDGSYRLVANTASKKFVIWLNIRKEGYKLYRKELATNSVYDHEVRLEKEQRRYNQQ